MTGGTWLIEQLQTKGTLNDGETIDYARGLFVSSYRGLRRGAWAGYRADLMRFAGIIPVSLIRWQLTGKDEEFHAIVAKE